MSYHSHHQSSIFIKSSIACHSPSPHVTLPTRLQQIRADSQQQTCCSVVVLVGAQTVLHAKHCQIRPGGHLAPQKNADGKRKRREGGHQIKTNRAPEQQTGIDCKYYKRNTFLRAYEWKSSWSSSISSKCLRT